MGDFDRLPGKLPLGYFKVQLAQLYFAMSALLSIGPRVLAGCLLALLLSGCATRTDTLPPRIVNEPVLDYPPEAILEHQQGTLVVRFQILEDGSAHGFKINQSTGVPILDQAGMELMERLECLPAVVDGKRQATWVDQKVIFEILPTDFDPFAWRNSTSSLIRALEHPDPARRQRLEEQLYEKCGEHMSSVISRPEFLLNGLALGIATPTVARQWGPYAKTFPMSFLMFADFLERFPDSPLRDRAWDQLRRSIAVDLRLIDRRLQTDSDPNLLQLRELLLSSIAGQT